MNRRRFLGVTALGLGATLLPTLASDAHGERADLSAWLATDMQAREDAALARLVTEGWMLTGSGHRTAA